MQNARRDRRKEAFWRRMMRGQAKSGLSIRAWCRRHDLTEASFYWWRGQLARRDAEGPKVTSARRPSATFVPVRVAAERPPADSPSMSSLNGPTGQIEIVLPGGRCVRLVGPVDRKALSNVLGVLSSEGVHEHESRTDRAGHGQSRGVPSC